MPSSSQSASFPPIVFGSTLPQQQFRLVELTPELVEIVESQRQLSNKRRKLWFKSSPSGTSRTGRKSAFLNGNHVAELEDVSIESGKEGFIHLCSEEKMWAVKQVSTSNSVHVARAMSAGELQSLERERPRADGGEEGGNDADTDMLDSEDAIGYGDGSGSAQLLNPTGGITSVAQVKNILELIEMPQPSQREVENMILSFVPVFGDNDTEGDKYSASNPPNVCSSDVFENIPAPMNTVLLAMRRLFLFEDTSPAVQSGIDGKQAKTPPPNVYIPSTNLLLKSWTLLTTQCAISGMNLDSPHGLDYGACTAVLHELTEANFDPSDGVMFMDVIRAIMRGSGEEIFVEVDDPTHIPCPKGASCDHCEHARLRLDPARTRDAVGKWLLASLVPRLTSLSQLRLDGNDMVSTEEFLEGWTKLLPDTWAADCDVHKLILSNGGWKITKDGMGEEVLKKVTETSDDAQVLGAGKPKARGKKKGKWHEKFGAQRSAALKK